MAGGRPTEYNQSFIEKSHEYLLSCEDEEIERGSEERPDYHLNVKLPTRGGLAVYLGVSRDTLYDWASKYPEFSYIMEKLGAEQEERLIRNGLSGDYNPTIAKVLLTKHGYREGQDITTNDKDLPIPLLNGLFNNDSNKENSEPSKKD